MDFGPVIEFKRPLLAKAFAAFEKKAPPRAPRGPRGVRERARGLAPRLRPVHGPEAGERRGRLERLGPLAREPRRGGARAGAARARRARCVRSRSSSGSSSSSGRTSGGRPASAGIRILGDIPIFVAHDSADVWAHPEIFHLAADGRPSVLGRRPARLLQRHRPAVGQPALPLGRARARPATPGGSTASAPCSRSWTLVRLDHFRGFEAYWEVPGDAETAVDGRWVKGPGAAFFEALAGRPRASCRSWPRTSA